MGAVLTNTHPALRRCWHPVALVADVPEDGPLAVPALSDGTPVPSKACVATALVAVHFGLVWLCLDDDPIGGFLDDAPYQDDRYDVFVAGPFTTRVSAGILADNFLDAGHFPYLHRASFGQADDGRPRLEVHRSGWTLHQTATQMVDGAHLSGAQEHHAAYTVALPFSVELRLDRADASDHIWSFACPVDDERTIWWMVHAYPLGGDVAEIAAARALQTQVGIEDLGMLERMEDPNLPLDVRVEVHTRADLGCLEYRRMLIELVAAAGETVS